MSNIGRKGPRIGGKKQNLDDFIESEFKKIGKAAPPQGSSNNEGNREYGDNTNANGQNSNFQNSPQEPYQRKQGSALASKPFTLKKSSIAVKKVDSYQQQQQQNFSGNGDGMDVEGSIGQSQQQLRPIPNNGEGSQSQQQTANLVAGPQGLNQKRLIAGNAILPKPINMKIKGKRPFVMDKGPQEFAQYDFKPKDDDVVESLIDNEPLYQPNTYGVVQGGGVTNLQQQERVNKKVQQIHVGPTVMINKVKQNLEESKIEGKRPTSQNKTTKQTKKDEGNDDDYSDDNYEDGFEDEGKDDDKGLDKLEQIRKAMDRQNKKALQYNEKKKLENQQQQQQSTTTNHSNPVQPQKKLDQFAQGKGLIVGERVDYAAANQQQVRAEELRQIVDLGQEEFFNMFEMIPQTPQDVYFSKLTAGTVKTAIVSCSDDLIDKDVQTEDLGEESKFNQAPEDALMNYKQNKGQYQRKKKRENEALNLEKFMSRAGPVMEQVIDENQQLFFLNNRELAQKRNAVELKSQLKFPSELLALFTDQKGAVAKLEKVTCIHMFESSPQSKCAVSYKIRKADNEEINLIVLFSVTANQVKRILRSETEVTSMCTPSDDNLLIAGTIVGSINLYDLKNFEVSTFRQDELDYNNLLKQLIPSSQEEGETNYQESLSKIKNRYSIQQPTFSTDGLPNYVHFSPIRKLTFITKFGGSSAQIGAIDELLTISTWSVYEIQAHIAEKMNDFDLNLSIGGRFKLLLNYSESLMNFPEVFSMDLQDLTQSLDLEFDSQDPNTFYFSSTEGLFKYNRKLSMSPSKLDTEGVGSPSSLSMSDKGFLLVGFTCGSIAIYFQNYTAPLTVWYNVCRFPITQIKWCYLYFNDDAGPSSLQSQNKQIGKSKQQQNEQLNIKFATRYCEFFAIDQSEDFQIWNLQKSIHKATHVKKFSESHGGGQFNQKLFRISNTCADQSFFTAFALEENSVNIYLMNFKKGNSITRDKLEKENKKSLSIISSLPLNLMSTMLLQ